MQGSGGKGVRWVIRLNQLNKLTGLTVMSQVVTLGSKEAVKLEGWEAWMLSDIEVGKLRSWECEK